MEISWDRLRRIFDNPQPPREVWEKQFDYNDYELQRLAKTPWEEIDFSDLWYYHHDLAHVELQPELFAYLFPVCLMDWHETLLSNESCSHGDSEFHYGVHQGQVLKKMLTAEQRTGVYEFFRDSFLIRLDQEEGATADGWMSRLNSLAGIMPRIDLLWDAWWSLTGVGCAVAAVQYIIGLMYFEDECAVVGTYAPQAGEEGPCVWSNDSLESELTWMPENARFLQETLSVEFVITKLDQATALLASEPFYRQAKLLQNDLPSRLEIVASRVDELPHLLLAPMHEGWTI